MKPAKVLITCVGGHYAIDTIQALRASRELVGTIVGVDAQPNPVTRNFVDKFIQVPSAAHDPAAFVDAMRSICQEQLVDLVIPGSDEEALALAPEHGSFHESGTRLAVGSPETMDQISHKGRTLTALQKADVTVPRFVEVDDLAALELFIRELPDDEQRFVVKPRSGRGSRDITIVVPNEDAAPAMPPGCRHRCITRGEAMRTWTDEDLRGMLVTEFLPGDVFDVDCVARDGSPVCLVVRRRLWPGPFSRGVEGHRIEHDERLLDHAAAVCRTLALDGVYDFDYGSHANGTPGLFEVNPRWSGSVATGVAAGINVPLVAVAALLDRALPEVRPTVGVEVRPVTRMLANDPGIEGQSIRHL